MERQIKIKIDFLLKICYNISIIKIKNKKGVGLYDATTNKGRI